MHLKGRHPREVNASTSTLLALTAILTLRCLHTNVETPCHKATKTCTDCPNSILQGRLQLEGTVGRNKGQLASDLVLHTSAAQS